ncbi:MAG: hypothetical protein LBT86_07445 [Deltaproteobacteria bacterium]|nr:hypothetical protein [Deltaproteobacteria bacterium]
MTKDRVWVNRRLLANFAWSLVDSQGRPTPRSLLLWSERLKIGSGQALAISE